MPFVPDDEILTTPAAPKKSRFAPDKAPAPAAPVDNDILSSGGMDQLSRTGSALAPSAPKKAPTQGDYLKSAVTRLPELVGGVGETILSGLTGAAASASNLVNAATGAKELFKTPGASDEDYYAQARENSTYSPRTQIGKDIGEGFTNTVGKVIEGGAQGVEQLTGSPVARELFTDAVNVAGTAAGGRAAKPKPKAEKPTTKTKISETPVESLEAGGFAVGPRDKRAINPTQKGTLKDKAVSALEGIAGREEVGDLRALNNQGTITKHIGKGLGFGDKITAITPTMLETKRAPHVAKHGEVGQTVGKFKSSEEFGRALDAVASKEGIDPDLQPVVAKIVDKYRYADMSGPDAVKAVSALRSKARRERRSEDVNTQDRGEVRQAIADAIEDEMGRALEASGNQKLLKEWLESRTALAKIYEAETALEGGQIDAKVYKRLKDRGAPLSGEAAMVADAAEYLKKGTSHSQSVAKGADVSGPKGSPFTDAISLGARPWLREKLAASPKTDRPVGPGNSLSDYFDAPEAPAPTPTPTPPGSLPPTSSSSQLRAQQLAGDLELAPEPMPGAQRFPPAPSRMTADTPPAQRGDIEFTPSRPQAANLAEDFGLETGISEGGLPAAPSARAPGMAGDLMLAEDAPVRPGQKNVRGNNLETVPWDAEASPGGPFEFARGVPYRDPGAVEPVLSPRQMFEAGKSPRDLTLADELTGGLDFPGPDSAPPTAPKDPTSGPSLVPEELSLGEQFGIKVTPSANEPGYFDISMPGSKAAVAVKGDQVTSFVEDLVGDMLSDEQMVSQPKPTGAPPPAIGKGGQSGFGNLENNASGESSASVEAINRVKSEKTSGRDRVAIDPDGRGTPLQGVDAVDATAPKGRLIVQRGVGKNDYSILDRGGLSITQANGLLNRFLAQLQRDE
jgi:hypothetical protein